MRADGRLRTLAVEDPGLDMVFRQALRFARNAAVDGCPLGDALPPKWVEIHDAAGRLVVRIMIDESLKPRAEPVT